MMRRVGVSDILIPAHSRNPGCSLVEGALGRGLYSILAVHVQLAADRADEVLFMFAYSIAGKQKRKGEARFLPHPKAGLGARIL